MKKIKKLVTLALTCTLLATALTACSGSGGDSDADTVKIAVAFPMTGNQSDYGKSFLAAAEIMVEKWNNTGGVLGKNIEILSYDDKNSSDEALLIADKIVSEKGVVGVLGHFSSGVSMAAAPTYNDNHIIEISNCASHPDYSAIGDYIFRNNPAINSEFDVMMDIIRNDLKLNKVAVAAIKTEWGNTSGAVAVKQIKAQPDMELVGEEYVLDGSDDYSSVVTKFNAVNAEVIVMVGDYAMYAPFARQYKAVNPDIKLVGVSNAYSQDLIELGGEAVNGIMSPVTFYADSDDPDVIEFVDAYTERTGSEPSSLAAQAYDCVGMLLTAVKDNGSTDKLSLRDSFADISYKGVTGDNEFDDNGDVAKSYIKVIIDDGQFRRYE